MTYDTYCAIESDLQYAYTCGEITEAQLYEEMERLQEQWEEECEE